MWIVSINPYIWDRSQPTSPDIGYYLVCITVSACGQNSRNLSTALSTERWRFYPIHILGRTFGGPYIWGYKNTDIFSLLLTSPQRKVLIHKKSRVIHTSRVWTSTDGGIPFHQIWLVIFAGKKVNRAIGTNQSTKSGSGSPITGRGLLT